VTNQAHEEARKRGRRGPASCSPCGEVLAAVEGDRMAAERRDDGAIEFGRRRLCELGFAVRQEAAAVASMGQVARTAGFIVGKPGVLSMRA
jgi:hypothetical protein